MLGQVAGGPIGFHQGLAEGKVRREQDFGRRGAEREKREHTCHGTSEAVSRFAADQRRWQQVAQLLDQVFHNVLLLGRGRGLRDRGGCRGGRGSRGA